VRRTAAIAVCLLVGLSAGCASGAEPPAVPPVGNARDARAADPCALPTAVQLATLGVTAPPTTAPAAEGPRCVWRGTPDHGPELGITLYTAGGGLAVLAENSEPTTARVRLAGYPALETFTGTGEFCQYDVGVAADQVVMASLQGGTPDSCTALQAVLPAMLATLPVLPT
jgi:uncharacterized protein DUF3558